MKKIIVMCMLASTLAIPPVFCGDKIEKVSDTNIKISTTVDQIVTVAQIKKDKGNLVRILDDLEKQYIQRKSQLTTEISRMDNIIEEAKKVGME